MSVLLLGLLTGIDNFVVSLGLGTARLGKLRLAALVAAFAMAEAIMPLIGFAIVTVIAPEVFEFLGPALLLLAGFLAAARAFLGMPKISVWVLFTIPLIMALDNLALGAGLGVLTGYGFSAALIAGLIAASVSTLGLLLGRLLPIKSPVTAQALLAACLVSTGLFELVGG